MVADLNRLVFSLRNNNYLRLRPFAACAFSVFQGLKDENYYLFVFFSCKFSSFCHRKFRSYGFAILRLCVPYFLSFRPHKGFKRLTDPQIKKPKIFRHEIKQEQEKPSDIEQQPPFGDPKYSNKLLQKRGGGYKTNWNII